ncbi:MAG: element excision factor XisI family protein [Cyanobacteriota bacterium]|nr:element excision factor XisI family protein [Cyanobacteriota bacterium]
MTAIYCNISKQLYSLQKWDAPVERGIPREDIVLAYHSPFMRQYDGFAVS